MTSRRALATMVSTLAIMGAACSSNTSVEEAHGSGGTVGSGGTKGSGGTTSSGGSVGSGGVTGSGGQTGSGGVTGSGGRTGSGGTTSTSGVTGSGGQTRSGGVTGSGGRTGSGGATVTGGSTSAGGGTGSGGVTSDGGRTGSGGSSAKGGTTSAGGQTGTGGGGGGSTATSCTATKSPGTAQTGDITIDTAKAYQTMDGFGIADVWQGKSTSSEAQRTLFWDPDQGIGMSILRIGIDENGKIMGDAGFLEGPVVSKFGGKVWAAPWSPPASAKDNNNINNGGHLLTSAYDSWSTTLAAFPAYYKQNTGADLWGISAQNEPDYVASYRSCIFDKTQMNNFIKVLGPKLKALDPPVHLLAAEPDTWGNTWGGDNFGTAIIGDATVSGLVDIIAMHDYDHRGSGNTTTRPSPPAGVKQHIWQTETTLDAGADIGPALAFDKAIYAAVTSGGASGWVYWWTPEFMNGGSTSSPPKRVYAMGNFSKFVRPGYVRVGISGVPSSVQIVSFTNADGTVAIVALNSGSSAVSASFFVSGSCWPSTVTPYVTSSSSNLAAGTAITVAAGRFSGSLAAQSVTTFVGKP
jgi:glucuronoarabinoxylan endo-1,4-beta-xylanase